MFFSTTNFLRIFYAFFLITPAIFGGCTQSIPRTAPESSSAKGPEIDTNPLGLPDIPLFSPRNEYIHAFLRALIKVPLNHERLLAFLETCEKDLHTKLEASALALKSPILSAKGEDCPVPAIEPKYSYLAQQITRAKGALNQRTGRQKQIHDAVRVLHGNVLNYLQALEKTGPYRENPRTKKSRRSSY